tara:strand:+ start:140 stop:475 length:336 start_codon:yes stop_codon:yes gene_type:complete
MVAPLAYGVFLLGAGARAAASQAGKAAAKYVVRKLGGKAASKLGKPLSSHRSVEAAKKAIDKITDIAGTASSKRKYGTVTLATEVEPAIRDIKNFKRGGTLRKKSIVKRRK